MYLNIVLTVLITLCCNENVNSYTNFNKLNTVKPIQLAAIGRVAKLGELYDSRLDQFLSLNLFKSPLPNASIDLIQNRETKLKYTEVNSYDDKFNALDISADLKLSILGGLFELEGSGRYFKNTKQSAKTEQASLINTFSTSYEDISITDSNIRSLVDFDIFDQIDATHIVVGIQWGGHVIITVEDSISNSIDSQSKEGRLGITMKKIGDGLFDASGSGQVNFSQSETNEMNKISFEIIGDLLPDITPQNFIDAIKFMKNTPTLLQNANNGKGKAMNYRLIPISILRKLWKINSVTNTVLNIVNEATVIRCVALFDTLNKVEQKINDLVTDVNRMDEYLNDKHITEINNLRLNFAKYQSEVRQNLSETLILVRSGNKAVDKLEDVINRSLNQTYANETIVFKEFNHIKTEILFIEKLLKKNITVLDKNTIMREFQVDNMNNDIYIYYYNNEFSQSNDDVYMTFMRMIQNKQDFGQKAMFVAINYEILNGNNNSLNSKQKVSMVRNGKVVVENYVIGSQPANENLSKGIENLKSKLNSYILKDELISRIKQFHSHYNISKPFIDFDNKLKVLFRVWNNTNKNIFSTFQSSFSLCESLNSTIIEIRSKQKQEIVDKIQDEWGIGGDYYYTYWLNGMRDTSGKWRWNTDGMEFNFTQWQRNEPNSGFDHKLVYIHYYPSSKTSLWWSTTNTDTNHIICEYELK